MRLLENDTFNYNTTDDTRKQELYYQFTKTIAFDILALALKVISYRQSYRALPWH
ncbi:hypothetical protein SK3146_06751 [Paenibacillus konkukensis]|uniref:Uncharacterized protein n=1 Tax=Paenibacillus konkukensis TaxID=2020716 RepID=A0ABY4S2J3_9BACL|nr:hypothetical protein SK3146_06751 [Paenibacillus konkukensis]